MIVDNGKLSVYFSSHSMPEMELVCAPSHFDLSLLDHSKGQCLDSIPPETSGRSEAFENSSSVRLTKSNVAYTGDL